MRKSLLFSFCITFLLISASAAISDGINEEDVSFFDMKPLIANMYSTFHSMNRTNTKTAVHYILSSLKTLSKHNSCYHMVSTLVSPLENKTSQFDALSILRLLNTLDIANRDCFPIIKFARKLINGAAFALNFSEKPFPKLRGNKLVSFDVNSTTITTAGEAVMFIADIVRFGEFLKEIDRISAILNSEVKGMEKIKLTIQGALIELKDHGLADLCTKEFDAAMYQLLLYFETLAKADEAFFFQLLVSLPYSANQDCLPFLNLIRYAAVIIGNTFYGLNNTYIPKEGGIITMADFGISSDSILGTALTAVGAGLDAWRCVLASVTAYRIDQWTYASWILVHEHRVTKMFEMMVLEALGGGTSCLNVYNAVRQLIGVSKN